MTIIKTSATIFCFSLVAIGLWQYSQQPKTSETVIKEQAKGKENQQLTINGVHYLLDVSDQDPSQIKSLLNRAEKVASNNNPDERSSRIVMVIHGPNVELFDKKNYQQNQSLIEQAARLDKSEVIDFIICQKAATARGIEKTSFPDFLEVVPFFGIEVNNLKKQGFVNL